MTNFGRAYAAPNSLPTGGITVAPAYISAQIGSKQPQTSATIGVRNNFDVSVIVTAELNGFDVRNNALVPTINAEKTFAGVVSLSPSEIVIEPGSSKNITVTVRNTPSLSPGGHYLSILLTETAVIGRLGTSQLSLKPAVSATLYVIKEDGAIRSLQAQSVRFQRSLFSLPSKADISFSNTGNVTVIPRGVVRISADKAPDSAIAQAVINQQSIPVLPQAAITLEAQFKKLSARRLPGHFQAVLEYRYDGQETVQQLRTGFWYIPKSFVIVLLLILTGIGVGLWPVNQQRCRNWWRRIHRLKAAPDVVPDPAKERPPAVRRKIDDIKKL